MKKIYKHQHTTWIAITDPTREEIVDIMETYKLHPSVAQELLQPTLRSKVDAYQHYISAVLHFPNIASSGLSNHELSFVVGKNFLITVQNKPFDAITDFASMYEVNSTLSRASTHMHSGYVFLSLLRHLYRELGFELDELDIDINQIEQEIFNDNEEQMVIELSQAYRRLLGIRQSIRYHRPVLESTEAGIGLLFGLEFAQQFRLVANEHERVADIVEGHRDVLLDLRSTNDALLTTKTNRIMKAITVGAVVIVPFTLVIQLLSMNTEVSFLNGISDIRLLYMFLISGGFSLIIFLLLRRKRWL